MKKTKKQLKKKLKQAKAKQEAISAECGELLARLHMEEDRVLELEELCKGFHRDFNLLLAPGITFNDDIGTPDGLFIGYKSTITSVIEEDKP